MKRTNLLLLFLVFISVNTIYSQTVEELTAQKTAKEAELAQLEPQLADLQAKVDGLKGEVASLLDQITPYPRWDTGLLGNIGLSTSVFNDWLQKDQPNTTALTIATAMGGFANADFEKSFWRNSTNLTLGWLKFKDRDNTDGTINDDFQVTADAFNFISLYGYKLTDKLAVSTLGEYRTSVLDGKFNNPGYLDLGLGATWTPITDLVVVFHPLNYNFVFADDDASFESSLGCKVVADYTTKIFEGLVWKSNFSGFLSYKGDPLHNWTWINGLSTAVKGVGIGLDFGLRGNKQEALAAGKDDNLLQTYWILGFSYAISSKK